jgi:hypothetical protein
MFHRSTLLPIGLPLVRRLGGEAATHYPVLYYALPGMYGRMSIILDVLAASILGGATTLLFARAFGLSDRSSVWTTPLRRAPALIATSIVTVGLFVGIAQLGSFVPDGESRREFAMRWLLRGTMLLMLVTVQSLMAYATAWIVLMGHGFLSAIRDSVRVATMTFVPTMIVVGIPALALLPLSYALGRADLIASRLRPEIVANLIGLQVIVQLLAGFFLIGGITRLFLWRAGGER